jgi:hypothetical protein
LKGELFPHTTYSYIQALNPDACGGSEGLVGLMQIGTGYSRRARNKIIVFFINKNMYGVRPLWFNKLF